jgi:hypothetical protein
MRMLAHVFVVGRSILLARAAPHFSVPARASTLPLTALLTTITLQPAAFSGSATQLETKKARACCSVLISIFKVT